MKLDLPPKDLQGIRMGDDPVTPPVLQREAGDGGVERAAAGGSEASPAR